MENELVNQERYEKFLYTPAEYSILLELSNLRICSAASASNEANEENDEKLQVKKELEGLDEVDEIYFLVSWSDYVFKILQPKLANEVKTPSISASKEFKFYSTANCMRSKIQNEPIFIKLTRGPCENLGSTQISFSECFSKSLGCEEFHAQTISALCKFQDDEQIKAIVDVSLKLMREVSACKEDDDGGSETEDSGSDVSEDFHCTDPSVTLKLDEFSYKVIDGNLVNLKDSKSNVGAVKCTDLFQGSIGAKCECVTSSNLRNSSAVTCPQCGGQKMQSKSIDNPLKTFNNWMDRNSNEEDILNRLCLKHGVSISDIRADSNQCEKKIIKKTKKQINRKLESCKKETADEIFDEQEHSVHSKPRKIRKRKSVKSKYSHIFGNSANYKPVHNHNDFASGIGDGHQVPKNMGWRWDSVDFGRVTRSKLWIPGQINSTVRCLMKNMLDPFPIDTLNLTRRNSKGNIIESQPKLPIVIEKKPTLTIQKCDGEYLITMHPLKDKSKLETDFDPYLKCSPLQFSIREDGEESKKQKAKKILASHGYIKNCSCPNLESCHCIDSRRKKHLLAAIGEVSAQLNMKKPLDYDDMTASSDSELDVEFVAPAAESKIGKRIANVVHTETQYSVKDFIRDFEGKLSMEKKNIEKSEKLVVKKKNKTVKK